MIINGDKIGSGNTQSPANAFMYTGDLVAEATGAVGGVITLQNTTGVDILVTNMIINITTVATVAATVDIGVDDAGDTSNDTIFDGLDVNTATGLFNAGKHGGTNGIGNVVWKKDEFIVATGSKTVAGLAGTYKVMGVAL